MTVSKDELISVLRLRYDPYSAEAVYELSRQRAELPNDKTALDHKDLAAFRAALAVVGDRVHVPLSHIDEMLASAPGASKQEAKAESKPEAKPEAKSEAKPEGKSDKGDSKKDKKAKSEETAPSATTIVLTGVDAEEGEQILVCGGLPTLGDWEPEKARAMERKGDEWSTTVELAADADVAFKFVRRTADGKLVWEQGGDRQLQAKPRVEATWRD